MYSYDTVQPKDNSRLHDTELSVSLTPFTYSVCVYGFMGYLCACVSINADKPTQLDRKMFTTPSNCTAPTLKNALRSSSNESCVHH